MSIIVLTNNKPNNLPVDNNIKVINEPVKLIDDYHLEYQNEVIEFDYLLAEDQSYLTNYQDLPFIIDNGVILTNWVGQTTIENIYVGNLDKALDELFSN